MKFRLIIDFDNEDELKDFFEANFEDLEKLKFLEGKSNEEIKTYYTEFEKDTREETEEADP